MPLRRPHILVVAMAAPSWQALAREYSAILLNSSGKSFQILFALSLILPGLALALALAPPPAPASEPVICCARFF
jgi:hypothetical protein